MTVGSDAPGEYVKPASIQDVDVLIVGSGPAGASTALHLVHKDLDWAGRILVLDQAVHPRPKLCGGGITHLGVNVLARLGYELEPRSFVAREVRLIYEDLTCSFRGNPVLNIVDRSEFDHWLVQKVDEAGVVVHQGERVIDLVVDGDRILVSTASRCIRAKCVVGADGALSTIRRRVRLDKGKSRTPRLARLIEVETSPTMSERAKFDEGVVTFDISALAGDLQGYYWEFPKHSNGRPIVSRGVFDSRVLTRRPRAHLKEVLKDEMPGLLVDMDDRQIKGHPIRTFHRTTAVSRPRVLLAGDAAGVDPLFGEGISMALAYGEVAADSLVDAFATNDFGFRDYRRRIKRHRVLWALAWRARLAWLVNLLDKPVFLRAAFRIASVALRFTRWADPEQRPIDQVESGRRPTGRA